MKKFAIFALAVLSLCFFSCEQISDTMDDGDVKEGSTVVDSGEGKNKDEKKVEVKFINNSRYRVKIFRNYNPSDDSYGEEIAEIDGTYSSENSQTVYLAESEAGKTSTFYFHYYPHVSGDIFVPAAVTIENKQIKPRASEINEIAIPQPANVTVERAFLRLTSQSDRSIILMCGSTELSPISGNVPLNIGDSAIFELPESIADLGMLQVRTSTLDYFPFPQGEVSKGYFYDYNFKDKVICVSVNSLAEADGQFSLIFKTLGGSDVNVGNVECLYEPPQTFREGYEFAGWHAIADFSDGGISYPYLIDKNTTLYAKWLKVPTIKFISNGEYAENLEQATRNITFEPTITRDGYEFDGWYETSDFSGEKLTFPHSFDKDTTLYAKWITPRIRVKFVANYECYVVKDGVKTHANAGYLDVFTQCASENSPELLIIESAPVVEYFGSNKKFDGWHSSCYSNSSVAYMYGTGESVEFPCVFTKDTTLYAGWIDTPVVKFYSNGSTVTSLTQTTWEVEAEPQITRKGYDFAGWYESSSFLGERVEFPFSVSKNTTLYAKWTEQPQCFFKSNGIYIDRLTVRTRRIETMPLPADAYGNFENWYENESFSGSPVTFPYEVKKNTTLYAKWTHPPVAKFWTDGLIIFDDYGVITYEYAAGYIDDFQTNTWQIDEDPYLVLNPDPSFLGWYLDSKCTGNAVQFPYTMCEDTTFYDCWIYETPVVQFSSNGVIVDSLTQTTFVVETEPQPPARSGYEFAGWYNTPTLSTERIVFPYTVRYYSTTLYAKWVKVYKVTFVTSLCTEIVKELAPDRTTALIETEPLKGGTYYRERSKSLGGDYWAFFKGWYKDSKYTEPKVSFPFAVTEDTTLYAKWETYP